MSDDKIGAMILCELISAAPKTGAQSHIVRFVFETDLSNVTGIFKPDYMQLQEFLMMPGTPLTLAIAKMTDPYGYVSRSKKKAKGEPEVEIDIVDEPVETEEDITKPDPARKKAMADLNGTFLKNPDVAKWLGVEICEAEKGELRSSANTPVEYDKLYDKRLAEKVEDAYREHMGVLSRSELNKEEIYESFREFGKYKGEKS